jgi:hypothetical protein
MQRAIACPGAMCCSHFPYGKSDFEGVFRHAFVSQSFTRDSELPHFFYRDRMRNFACLKPTQLKEAQ